MINVFEYAEELRGLGRVQEALAEYNDLLDANLGGIEPLLRRSALLRELGLLSEAQAELRRAAEIDSTNGWPLLLLAQMARDRGSPLLAACYVKQAQIRQPETAEMRVNAAAIYSSLEWVDLAFQVVRSLPNDMGDWWGDMRRTAEAAYYKHHSQALARLRCRKKTGGGEEARQALCSDLFKLGKLHVARKICETLMRADTSSFESYELYARIVAREHGASEAVSFLRAITFLHGEKLAHSQALKWMESQVAFR